MRHEWDERARENARYYIANHHWETEAEFERSGEADLNKMLTDIGEFLSPDMTVLEIGCGIGRLLKPLARRFRTVYGVDISPEMVRLAKERLKDSKNVKVWVNNGWDLRPIRTQQADLVVSYIVFGHIPEVAIVRSYIEEAFRVLKPGGLFEFQVSGHEDTPEARKDEEERVKDTVMGVHFTQSGIRRMTAKAGFRVLSTTQQARHYGAELLSAVGVKSIKRRKYFRRTAVFHWVVAQKP